MLSKLDLIRARKAIHELSRTKGIDEKSMRLEMEKAIEAGFSSQDPSIKKVWSASPFRDYRPSPEEFILWCVSQL